MKQGAKLVETVDDIVEELLPQIESIRTPLSQDFVATEAAGAAIRTPRGQDRSATDAAGAILSGLSEEERAVLASLSREPRHLDDLTERSRLTTAAVAGILLGLELKALVKQLPGQRYCLKR